MAFEDALTDVAVAILGKSEINEIVINKLASRGRSRPHPWTTKYDYIGWAGLTDRTYVARLLAADKAFPTVDVAGTRRPPAAGVAALFATANGGTGPQQPCRKSTCLFPAFAQYLTDGFLRTMIHDDETQSQRARTTSNHEIDMSTLYGRTPVQTAALREPGNFAGGRGRLRSQILNGEEYSPWLFKRDGSAVESDFTDLDLPLGLPRASAAQKLTLFAVGGDRVNSAPQTAMMNTLFLREHNRLAGLLEAANPGWPSDQVFETARNIVIVTFIKIVVEDYINHINDSGFAVRCDPRIGWNEKWYRTNWMTAEFTLLYRWHQLVPKTLNWDSQTIGTQTLLLDNSRLITTGLAKAFTIFSANSAMELRLHNTADFLLPAETFAVKQARENRVPSFNEYLLAMGKKKARSFADVVGQSSNAVEQARLTALAGELQALYGHVDNLEFYTGLFAEPVKKNGPLPSLLTAMVAMDAFSQALTNPLLSRHIWGDATNKLLAFTDIGIKTFDNTKSLRDVVARNATLTPADFIGFTKPGWRRR